MKVCMRQIQGFVAQAPNHWAPQRNLPGVCYQPSKASCGPRESAPCRPEAGIPAGRSSSIPRRGTGGGSRRRGRPQHLDPCEGGPRQGREAIEFRHSSCCICIRGRSSGQHLQGRHRPHGGQAEGHPASWAGGVSRIHRNALPVVYSYCMDLSLWARAMSGDDHLRCRNRFLSGCSSASP